MAAILSFTAASVGNIVAAGESALSLRAADSLLHSLDDACRIAIASGNPQSLKVGVLVDMDISASGGRMEAAFEAGGKRMRVLLNNSWCSGWAKSTGRIEISSEGVLQT